MTVTDIRQLTNPVEAPPIAELIATAYAPLAISRWLVPDSDQRQPILAAGLAER